MSALACSALFTAIAAIFVTLYPAAFGVDVTSVEDKVLSGGHLDGTTYKLIFGPIHMGCGVAQLEQPSRKDAVPTLRLTLKGQGGSDARSAESADASLYEHRWMGRTSSEP